MSAVLIRSHVDPSHLRPDLWYKIKRILFRVLGHSASISHPDSYCSSHPGTYCSSTLGHSVLEQSQSLSRKSLSPSLAAPRRAHQARHYGNRGSCARGSAMVNDGALMRHPICRIGLHVREQWWRQSGRRAMEAGVGLALQSRAAVFGYVLRCTAPRGALELRT